MSRTHFWADLHLGHEKLAQLRGFDRPEEHDQHLVDAWSATVRKNDVVWVLGDLCLGSPARAIELVAALPGAKRLILGNHDVAHPMHRNAHSHQHRYFTAFQSVQTMARVRLGGQDFMLSHYPYWGDSLGEDRGVQYRLRDQRLPLIHGHVHDQWLTKDHQINVGVERWMGGPASAEDVLELHARGN